MRNRGASAREGYESFFQKILSIRQQKAEGQLSPPALFLSLGLISISRRKNGPKTGCGRQGRRTLILDFSWQFRDVLIIV
jgi:hypothetical protein